jgi:type I restriction enzyme M protein
MHDVAGWYGHSASVNRDRGNPAEAGYTMVCMSAAGETVVVVEEESAEGTRSGYIRDFVSGVEVRATPEEVDAVQVFARRLVDDLGYELDQLQTRPQFRVRRSPSDEKKSYPVDIAVFEDHRREDERLKIVVECKKRNRSEGRRQLELYLTMSHAELGAWFNGDEHLYLRKQYRDGEILFDEIPVLPRRGQRIEDIGRYKRKDLRKSEALRPIFRDLRNHLAGNLTGITRDQTLAPQVINVLFCKVFDEMDKGPEQYMDFRYGVGEDPEVVHQRLLDLFAQVKDRYGDVFAPTDAIELDPVNLAYMVGELQNYAVTEASRDAIGDAFEVFIGPTLRGEEGQFFTPRNVVHMMVDVLDPASKERVIDPACGSGGFLIAALEHAWRRIERDAEERGWDEARIAEERRYVASRYFKGIEKDRFLAKVTKAYMAIVGDGRSGIYCQNSLLPPNSWDPSMAKDIELGSFDVILTNPPFGSKIKVKGRELLEQYDMGHQFVRDKADGRKKRSDKRLDAQMPQLLFIERCLQLLKPGGRMGIVMPESVLGMPTYSHVVQWLRERCRVVGVVSMPEDLFQPHTHAKTCVVFIKNEPPTGDGDIFMSIVEWCGHDSRGNPTVRRNDDGIEELLDDVPRVAGRFRELMGSTW